MTRVAYFLLLGVALAFVLSVNGQSNSTDSNSVQSPADDSQDNVDESFDQSDENEDDYDGEDNYEDEDSDENYMNDEAYVEYYQDEEDVGDEKEDEEVEVPAEVESSPDVLLPPCKPEYMFQQLDKVCAKYRDEDITELEKKCKEIGTAIADIRDLISKSYMEPSFLIEKDDTTWTQKLSYPAIVPERKAAVEILFDRKAEDSGISGRWLASMQEVTFLKKCSIKDNNGNFFHQGICLYVSRHSK